MCIAVPFKSQCVEQALLIEQPGQAFAHTVRQLAGNRKGLKRMLPQQRWDYPQHKYCKPPTGALQPRSCGAVTTNQTVQKPTGNASGALGLAQEDAVAANARLSSLGTDNGHPARDSSTPEVDMVQLNSPCVSQNTALDDSTPSTPDDCDMHTSILRRDSKKEATLRHWETMLETVQQSFNALREQNTAVKEEDHLQAAHHLQYMRANLSQDFLSVHPNEEHRDAEFGEEEVALTDEDDCK